MSLEFERTLTQSQGARRKTLAEWRAGRYHEMDLPSGLHVKVRDVDMTDLLLTGLLPPAVAAAAEEAAKITDAFDLQKQALKLMQESGPEFKKLLNAIAIAALVDPKIGDVADDTHITVDELTIEDKSAIMEFIDREVGKVQTFRGESDRSVAGVQPRDSLLEKTE